MTASEEVPAFGTRGAGPAGVAEDFPRPRRTTRWLLAVTAAALLLTAAIYYRRTGISRAAPVAKGRVVRAEMRDVTADVVATGTIRLRSGAEVRVGAQISGIVTVLNVTVGSHVKKGDVIAEIESRGLHARIAQSKSQIQVDEAALQKARWDLDLSHQLLDAQLVARQQTEDLEADVSSAEARLQKSRSDLAVVESDLPYLTIRAPIAGTIASVSTERGETVAAQFNAPTFVTIIQDNALELIAMIDETDIGNVRPSNPVVFTTETFPARDFRGVVERVAPRATIISGVVNYETGIAIQTGAAVLKPDMTANVTIATAHQRSLMIPVAALHQDGPTQFVYLERSNGTAEKRGVVAGLRHGAWTEISSGLQTDDPVLAPDAADEHGGER